MKLISIFLIVINAGLFFRLLNINDGLFELMKFRHQLNTRHEKLLSLIERNDFYAVKLDNLKHDPEMLEYIARHRFSLKQPSEKFFLLK